MLINCAVYENGKKLADIAREDIHRHLGHPDRFVWVALRDPTAQELEEMRVQFDLHELAVEDALHGHQRPKVEEYGDCLFAVMHTLELTEDESELLDGEVNVFVGRDYLLSVRKRKRVGFAVVRERAEREPHLLKEGPGYVLYLLLDAVVDSYFPVIDALEAELERIESRIFEGDPARENVEALYSLKRKMTLLRHASGPLHEAVGKLYGGRVPAVTMGVQEYLRDVYDHLTRINQSIDSLRDMLTHGDHRQPVARDGARERDDETARRLRGAGCHPDDDRGDLRDELRAHAGAPMAVRLSRHARGHGGRGHLHLPAVQEGGVDINLLPLLRRCGSAALPSGATTALRRLAALSPIRSSGVAAAAALPSGATTPLRRLAALSPGQCRVVEPLKAVNSCSIARAASSGVRKRMSAFTATSASF